MYILALTGLHGAGKSFLSKMLIQDNWLYLNKREELKKIYSKLKRGNAQDDWENWYKSAYQTEGTYSVMKMVFESFEINKGVEVIVFDSVHNVEEWRYISNHFESLLAIVYSLREKRYTRVVARDGLLKEDNIRIQSIHAESKGQVECLYCQADWSICNNGSTDFVDIQLRELTKYILCKI